jgi:hypothetical protein
MLFCSLFHLTIRVERFLSFITFENTILIQMLIKLESRRFIQMCNYNKESVCMSAPFVRCGKKFKVSSEGGDSGSKKCKRGYGGAHGGVWRSVRLAIVWSQAVGFVLLRLAGIWLQSP